MQFQRIGHKSGRSLNRSVDNITVNSTYKNAVFMTASHHKGIIKKIDRYTNDLTQTIAT